MLSLNAGYGKMVGSGMQMDEYVSQAELSPVDDISCGAVARSEACVLVL